MTMTEATLIHRGYVVKLFTIFFSYFWIKLLSIFFQTVQDFESQEVSSVRSVAEKSHVLWLLCLA